MTGARGMWDSAKHFRGYHGRFATGGMRTGGQREVRSPAAFHPATPASDRREQLRHIKAAVNVFNKDARTLTPSERAKVEWASPAKQKAQLQLTGDVRIPRREGMRREADLAGRSAGRRSTQLGGHRDLIRRHPRTGKVQAYRGTSEVELASGRVVAAKRARKLFTTAPPKPAPTPASTPAPLPTHPALMTDAALRAAAVERGIDIPPRAGRNQILKLLGLQ